MNADTNVRVVLEVFAAIEQRDAARFLAHTHSEVSICWPPSLPWNDGVPGRPDPHGQHPRSWLEVWAPLQPTAAERQMHPEVIAAADDRVVVRWRQRGRSPTGLGFDGQVLGLYQVREGRLARAQMFYFDTDAVKRFLGDAAGQGPPKPAGRAARGRPMSGDGVGGAGEGQVHPNARLLEAFYEAQAAFYAGGDDTATLRGLLADDIAWHVPGRSPIAGHYHGHQEVLGYFAARRAHAKATFRVHARAILADDQRVVQLADGQLERDGRLRSWQTVGVFRIADGKIAEC